MDLFATGDTRRLTKALEAWLGRLGSDLHVPEDETSLGDASGETHPH
jgi:hypothetical protein